ncbi:MAG: SDR family oxidoreductase [Rhodospirillales bacterium]|nr:SDR family oxidoreductase [Rhodospirillales bacterium]
MAGVVEEFRHPDVNFLTPAPPAEITTDTVLDVSHESLIRQWPRLRERVAKEAESARIYSRAKGYADEWAEGKDMARLLRPPELDFGLRWQREGSPKPNPAWAKRYDDGNEGSFELVNQYLDLSAARREEERQEAAAREYGRRRQQVIRFGGPILVVLLAVFAGLAGLAFRGWSKSEANLKMANDNADQARKNEEAAIRNAAQAARERVQTQVAYLQRDGIDLLANVAGWDVMRPFLDTDPVLWDRIIRINLYGPLHMHHVVLPRMVAAGFGRVVNVASDAGRVGSSGEAVYAACKGGIIAFTKTMARELARSGITLNVLCPGPTDTPLFAAVQADSPAGPKIAEAMARAIPLKRIGQPQDYPGAIAFLLSDDSAYVTGQTLSVSGGLTMV